jgi:hypothetical protein
MTAMRGRRRQWEQTLAANPKLATSDPWPMKIGALQLQIEPSPAAQYQYGIKFIMRGQKYLREWARELIEKCGPIPTVR